MEQQAIEYPLSNLVRQSIAWVHRNNKGGGLVYSSWIQEDQNFLFKWFPGPNLPDTFDREEFESKKATMDKDIHYIWVWDSIEDNSGGTGRCFYHSNSIDRS